MSPEDFLTLVLALPGVEKGAHMGRADFRIAGRIFATLGPEPRRAVVLLSPEEQAVLVAAEPTIFQPVPGGWGTRGSTLIDLGLLDKGTARSVLAQAWRRKAPKRLQAAHPTPIL